MLLSFRTSLLIVLHSLLLICSAYTPLSNDTLQNRLPQPSVADFDINTGALLSPLLIPRVPGTPGSTAALNHLANFFRTNLPAWTITFQNSTFKTPVANLGEVPFVNLIATRDPPGTQEGDVGRLTLVAHYDSKYHPEGFIGATDSAAPVAMIMHAVHAIDGALTKKWVDYTTNLDDLELDFPEHKGIQVIFLDGEEAFVSWTATDSIYGARSLAEEWDNTLHAATSTYKNALDSISLFMLLDLLGSGEESLSCPVPSWMQSTHWAYQHLATAESRLRSLGLFQSHNAPDARTTPWLMDANKPHNGVFNSYYMQDDHIPFVARGVECLHLIPQRFPTVWHTMRDDGEHLHIPTVLDWAMLTSVFAAEWMELEGFFDDVPREVMGIKRVVPVSSKTEL